MVRVRLCWVKRKCIWLFYMVQMKINACKPVTTAQPFLRTSIQYITPGTPSSLQVPARTSTRVQKLRYACASRSKEGILPLCSARVRLQLECCAQCWAPQYKRDMDTLDRVQGRATKMMKGLECLS